MAVSHFVQPGEIVEFVAPFGGVVSKTAILIGSALVIPLVTAAEGAKFSGQLEGVWKMPKGTAGGTAITQGARVWWDVATGTVVKVPGANKLAGVCVLACGDADTQAWILLDRCAIFGDESAASAAVAAAVAVTNGGAGNTGLLLKLDAAGKVAGRVLETDGLVIDAINAAATSLDAAAPAIDGTAIGPVSAALKTGRRVWGCIGVTTEVANGALFKAQVETAAASGVYKDSVVGKIPAGIAGDYILPYSFQVPPGCRYKFDKVLGGGAAAVAFGGDGYNFADL